MRSSPDWRESDAWLEERLLRGGVAPRHVQRSLRELRDHRSDLLAALQHDGWSEADAARGMHRLLGAPEHLASQILARPELRSRARRFRWLVFGVAPFMACTVLSLAIGGIAMDFFRVDLWLVHLLALWLVPAALCGLVIAAAVRRRMPHPWPVTGILLMVLVSGGTGILPGWIFVGPTLAPVRTAVLLCALVVYVVAHRARRMPCQE